MARNDGIDRTIARNQNLTASKITNAQRHNEREKESYTNPDIVPERLSYNVHFKSPTGSYAEMFEQMKSDGVISTRGLKDDAKLYGVMYAADFGVSVIEAMRCIYKSDTYRELENEDNKLWHHGPVALYQIFLEKH